MTSLIDGIVVESLLEKVALTGLPSTVDTDS
jgi:hypothetical protein